MSLYYIIPVVTKIMYYTLRISIIYNITVIENGIFQVFFISSWFREQTKSL